MAVRTVVFNLVAWEKPPEAMSLRDAVEWYKKVARSEIGTTTGEEVDYINQRWGTLTKALAERQGVPAGFLSYMLNELATTELKVVEVALDEAEVALSYGEPKQEEGHGVRGEEPPVAADDLA